MADEAPQWLKDSFERQAQQIAALSDLQTSSMARLESRIALYEDHRQETQRTTPPPRRTPSPIQVDLPQSIVRKPKPCLPHPEKFDGSELSFFPQFEGLLRAKLEIDGQAIGQEKERVWYAFGRLSGGAAARIFPWMEYAARQHKLTVYEFMEQLRTAFRDPRQQQKALGQINRTKQGSLPFADFLNEFNRLILEAEGWGWDDVIKKGYLKAAISTKLLSAMIGIQEHGLYDGYCQQLRMVNDQMNEVAELTAWRTKKARGVAQMPAIQQTTAEPSYDTMDWQPTVAVSSARTKEPRWASDEVIEERRRAGQCLRCGLDGHRVRECRAKLRFPKKKTSLERVDKKIRAAPARKDDALPMSKSMYKDVSGSEESGKRIASGKKRSQKRTKVLKAVVEEWKKFQEKSMDGPPFLVSTLVNRDCFAKTLLDSGCLSYGLVSSSFVIENDLQRIKIPARSLSGFDAPSEDTVTEVAVVSLDIDGHHESRSFLYVVPRLESYDIILGLPWIVKQDARINGPMSECLIRSTDTLVRNQASTLEPDHTLDCAPISIKAFCMMTTKSRQRNVEVFSASLRDIAKALDKTKKTKTDPRTKLPSQYLDYLGAFSPTDSDKTPPLRGNGVDHKIELVKEDGKEPSVPWGPLYNMSYDELLVLRKTLTEYLDKGFIRVSNSPAAAPVLFVRKPGGGLRFCVDYRALKKSHERTVTLSH